MRIREPNHYAISNSYEHPNSKSPCNQWVSESQITIAMRNREPNHHCNAYPICKSPLIHTTFIFQSYQSSKAASNGWSEKQITIVLNNFNTYQSSKSSLQWVSERHITIHCFIWLSYFNRIRVESCIKWVIREANQHQMVDPI